MTDSSSSQLFDLPPNRRWHQQLYPAPIVVAIIRRTVQLDRGTEPYRYLLIKRKSDPYNGLWALVGGKWDFGEALHEAILRETKEETNLDASFVAVRGIVSERISPTNNAENGAHFLLFVCELNADNGKAEEQYEGPIAWFTRSEIDKLQETGSIIPSDYAMINSFAEANETVPHIEAEMRASVRGNSTDPLHLLKFERINNSKSAHET